MHPRHRLRQSSIPLLRPSGLASPRSKVCRHIAAFTLVEMLIAMTIAAIMFGLVVYLFGQTQRGTRVSLARAQMTLVAVTAESRLRLDGASMLGPNRLPAVGGGCLVIVPAIHEGYLPTVNGQMSKNRVRLRSDQLVFISKRDPTHPHPWVSLMPQNQNGPLPTMAPSASSSWEARIWYGAIQDGNYPAGDGSVQDLSRHAHLWSVGRQAKLFTGGAGVPDVTVTPDTDTTPGSDQTLETDVLTAPWSDTNYVAKLAVPPNSPADYTNQPVATAQVDIKALQRGDTASGIQLDDLVGSHLRLLENCSEIVIQWAGDLDKDGKIDTYPAGHPLAGAIIWYPEELHNKGAPYDGYAAARLDTALLAKYNAIKTNDWKKAFPTGFATSASRFGGRLFAAKGFEFEYGDVDHATSPAPVGTPSVPDPYVFRFDDDQYRLVRYGFRQDGSVYANAWDGMPLPNPAGGAPIVGKHWFPYPPLAAAPSAWNSGDPSAASLYVGKAAPNGPYPRTATAMVAGSQGKNFGDLMGMQMLPADAMQGVNLNVTGPNGEKYRTGGTGQQFLADGVTPDPNQYGQWVKVTYTTPAGGPPWWGWTAAPSLSLLLTPPDSTGAVAPALYSAAQISALTNAPVWPYYSGGNLVAIRQIDGAVIGTGTAKPADDPTADTTPFPCAANQTGPMAQAYGPDNNYTQTYTDVWAEYLKTINDPAKVGTREDWRMPQSDWPKLLRIRVRLHDPQGLVTSYSDEFLLNGRDDDGDGVVDNPEEGRMAGAWFEYILAVPYPMDSTPRSH